MSWVHAEEKEKQTSRREQKIFAYCLVFFHNDLTKTKDMLDSESHKPYLKAWLFYAPLREACLGPYKSAVYIWDIVNVYILLTDMGLF